MNSEHESTNTDTPTPVRATKCCGCSCDYRNGVIIVDIVITALETLAFILLATDSTTSYFLSYQDEYLVTTEMIFSATSIITGLFSIYGAYIFNIWPVLLNVAWLIGGFVAGLIVVIQWCHGFNETVDISPYASIYDKPACTVNPFFAFAQATIVLLWIYPHIGFVLQVTQCCYSVESAQTLDILSDSHVVVTQAYPIEKMERGPFKV